MVMKSAHRDSSEKRSSECLRYSEMNIIKYFEMNNDIDEW